MLARTLARSLRPATRSTAARALVAATTPRLSSVVAKRTLSSSAPRFEPTPLSAKLTEEINFEAENAESETEQPEFLTNFLSEGVWAVEDKPGNDEVILTRSFGNESIRLIFSISDLDAEAEADEYLEPEEGADAGSGGVGDEALGGPSDESFPVETSITITKAGGGALSIDAVAQDGLFSITNIAYYNDADLALGMSSEEDWKRQGLYMGPSFDNLDEGVQAEFENYLEERGINSALALFIPDLAEFKEQREYVAWLKNVNEFLER